MNVGGPAIQAMLLTERLDPARYESLLIYGRSGPREGDMLAFRGHQSLRPLLIPELGREISLLADLRALYRLVRILRAYRPDVVHTHLAKAGLLGRLAARLAGVPVVIHTFHGNVLHGYFGPVRSALFLRLERLMAFASTRLIAISDRQLAELGTLRIGQPEQLVRLPLGFDLAPFIDPPRGELRAELGVGPATPLVGIVGRLVPIKAVDVFLAAAARIAERRADAHFVIVGDGEQRDALVMRATELGLAPRIHFLGWRRDVGSIYADLDVVVLTSRNEGTPVSIIEALAASRGVVATDVGGVSDVVGEAGVLVPPDDPEAVTGAVITLLSSSTERNRLGAIGRARVCVDYDQATLLDRIDRLYQDLLARVRFP